MHIAFNYNIVNCKRIQTHKCTIAPSPFETKSPLPKKKLTNNVKQDKKEAPIDQPRRLSLRRPSFKEREIVANESFIDIQLKPVTKDKATPQNAQQTESNLTKVTQNRANFLFAWLSSHRLCRRIFFLCYQYTSIHFQFFIYLYCVPTNFLPKLLSSECLLSRRC